MKGKIILVHSNLKKTLLICGIVVLIDQIIKNILFLFMNFGDSISIINNFFSITFVGNTGAAFNILSSHTLFLIIISILALNLIYFFFIKNKDINRYEKWLYGVLIGGILGNLIDRIFRGYVVDYLDFNIFGYSFPIFNFADICIVISIVLIVIDTYRGNKNEVKS